MTIIALFRCDRIMMFIGKGMWRGVSKWAAGSVLMTFPVLLLCACASGYSLPAGLPDTARRAAYEVSPEVYELRRENERFRVMLARWKPGQSDDWHTHHGDVVNYSLSDCKLQGVLPGGNVMTLVRQKGDIGFNGKDSIHKVTNAGEEDCTMLIIEQK